MVTGLPTATAQVAVTCIVGEAERCTDGSLTVQLEFTSVEVFAVHTVLPESRPEALKTVPLAGAAAVWSTVIDPGVTLNAVKVQWEEEEFPPQPAIPNNAAHNRTDANILHGNIGFLPFIVEAKRKLYAEPALQARVADKLSGTTTPRLFPATILNHEALSSLTSDVVSCGSNSRRLSDQLTPRRGTAFGGRFHNRRAGCHGSHHSHV